MSTRATYKVNAIRRKASYTYPHLDADGKPDRERPVKKELRLIEMAPAGASDAPDAVEALLLDVVNREPAESLVLVTADPAVAAQFDLGKEICIEVTTAGD